MPRMARPPNPDPRDPRVPVHEHFSPCGNLVDPGHPDATPAPRPVRPGTPPPERYLGAVKRARLVDVAERAGVSRTTASAALGGRGRIGEETRRHVLAVAAAMGYE